MMKITFCIIPLLAALNTFGQCGHIFHRGDFGLFDYHYKIITPKGKLIRESTQHNEDYILFQTCDGNAHHIEFFVGGKLVDRYAVQKENDDFTIRHDGIRLVQTADFLTN